MQQCQYSFQLNEAWITAVNIDKLNLVIILTQENLKMGQTAQYCLGADGWNIVTINYANTTARGSVYAVIMDSRLSHHNIGAVALLAEHFQIIQQSK